MGVITAIRDGLANLITGAGTSVDKSTHAFYYLRPLTPDQVEAAYRTSWLMRKIVDLPPYDMTRAGRDWQGEADQITLLEAEESRLQLWHKLRRALVVARLYGGGAIVMGVAQGQPDQELRLDGIGKGALKYLHVMSRWQLSAGEQRRDPEDPWFGHPLYYEISYANGQRVRLHPSRVIPFIGQPAPEGTCLQIDWFWGDPIMQSIEAAIKNADKSQDGFATLIDEASIDTFGVPDLMSQLASPEYEQRFMRRLELWKLSKSLHRAGLKDAAETIDTRQVSWTGMPEIIHSYLQLVAGAADIPATRLLGQAPQGMNSTGEHDERNYRMMIAARQDTDLRPGLERIDEVMIRSVLGTRPEELFFTFRPIVADDPKVLADTEKVKADTVTAYVNSGLVPVEALQASVKARLIESGQWPGLEAAWNDADAKLMLEPDEPDDGDLDDPSAIQDPPPRRAANDAAPRTLYVCRKVVNANEIIAWAKDQGIPNILDDLHVTIAYSRQPVDWIKAGNASDWGEQDGKLAIAPGGPRVVEPLGGMTAVLMFASSVLAWRHEDIKRAGASWDWDDYQPHISLTKSPVDLSKVEPYRGKIVLGPEVFEELRLDA